MGKICLARHVRKLVILLLVAAMGVGFLLGRYTGISATNRKAYAALWEAIIDLPDPEQCALCRSMRYHAPCLINLSTGQMGELMVYTEHPTHQGEIAPAEMQQTGIFSFQSCAGLFAARDTSNHTCKITLPAQRELMNPALFCRECRQILAKGGLEGYVIVDLYDRDNVQAYPLQREVIRDYRISVVNRKDGKSDVCVTGLLEY